MTYRSDMSYLFLVSDNFIGIFACAARLKIFAVRILLVQMLESEQKAICDGMDGAAISAK